MLVLCDIRPNTRHLFCPLPMKELCSLRRMSSLDAFEELRAFAPEREWRLILVAGALEEVDCHRLHLLGENCSITLFSF